jgi:hypothetical protein
VILLLSRERKIAIFNSYPYMVVRKMSNDRITIDYTASKAPSKVIAHILEASGKGYVNGKYMSERTGYKVHSDGFISIADFTEDELHTIIRKAIQSMSILK